MFRAQLLSIFTGQLDQYDEELEMHVIGSRFRVFFRDQTLTIDTITEKLFQETWENVNFGEKYKIRELIKSRNFYSIGCAIARFLFYFLYKQGKIKNTYWNVTFKREKEYDITIRDYFGYIKINTENFTYNTLRSVLPKV